MKNLSVNGRITHDLMTLVMLDLYPSLVVTKDYLIGHPIDPVSGEQTGDPDFMMWAAEDQTKPKVADLIEHFRANEAKYRAIFARRYRDACLESSDARVMMLPDAPHVIHADADGWKIYRQALRDIPQQADFPLDIDWPAMPGEEGS